MKLNPKHVTPILLVLMFFWSLMYPFSKLITNDISAVNLALLRFAFGAVTLFAFIYLTKKKLKIDKKDLLPMCLAGILGNAMSSVLLFSSLKFTTSTSSSIIANFNPVIVAIFASFFIKEKLGKTQVLGILLSFIGMALVVSNGTPLGQLVSSSYFQGNLLALGSAICIGFNVVLIKKYIKKYGGLVATFYALAASAAGLFVLSLATGDAPSLLSLNSLDWLVAGYIGIAVAGICFAIWYSTVPLIGATKASSFKLLIPMYATLVSLVLLFEMPSIFVLCGGVLLLAGLYLTHEVRCIDE